MNINWPRAVARSFPSLAPCLTVFCAIFCASLISMPAAAQDTQATQSSSIDTQSIVARPIPKRTVGLAPGKIVKWNLRDAILAAYEKNVDIELQREEVRMIQYDLIAAQGYYDPMTTSTILYNKSITPTSNRASGLVEGNTINNNTATYNFGMVKQLERWGGTLQGDFFNQRSASNTNTLTTSYSPQLQFQFTQPLFKNFAIDQARRNIKVTRRRLDITDAQFRQKLIDIITQVTQAYWDLSLAIQNEIVQRDAVGLAETFLDNTKRQVEVGTLAPIEVIFAATQLEQRRQQVFQAMNQVGIAENALKNLTAGGPKDELWSSVIEPIEKFEIKSVSIPVEDAINLAHENRPEIRQLNLSQEINKIDIDFYRNQAKPQIDFVAGYSTNGLGGTGPLITRPDCSPVPVKGPDGQDLQPICATLGLRQDAPGVFTPIAFDIKAPTITSQPPVSDQFIGGYGTALGNLFKNQFRTWSVGVQFSLPLRNRVAKANLGKALEQQRQVDLQNRQLLQLIEVDVRNAVQSVETAKMRIEAAQAGTKYAQLQLEGEEKKFAAGLQSTYFVLDRQNQLSVARLSELQALADYNKAIANLQRVMSTTLSSNSIEVKQEAPVKIK